jgi:hypothetical protein
MYASEDYQRTAKVYGMAWSMRRRAKGYDYDTVVMDASVSSPESEAADRFPSCGEARLELFDYIEDVV